MASNVLKLVQGRRGLQIEGWLHKSLGVTKLGVPDRGSPEIPVGHEIRALRIVHDTNPADAGRGVAFVRIEHDPACTMCIQEQGKGPIEKLLVELQDMGLLSGAPWHVGNGQFLPTKEALAFWKFAAQHADALKAELLAVNEVHQAALKAADTAHDEAWKAAKAFYAENQEPPEHEVVKDGENTYSIQATGRAFAVRWSEREVRFNTSPDERRGPWTEIVSGWETADSPVPDHILSRAADLKARRQAYVAANAPHTNACNAAWCAAADARQAWKNALDSVWEAWKAKAAAAK